MNWGYKIILVYAVFVGGIVLMVVKSGSQNVDLVRPDYYEEELKYQETIDATRRANSLSNKVTIVVKHDSLFISFPSEMKQGSFKANVWLYCIADVKKDLHTDFTSTDGIIRFGLPPNNKGLHDVKVSWVYNSMAYYTEQKLFIQ